MKGTEKMQITIDEDGNVEVLINGVIGKGCHAISDAMSQALGKTTKDVSTADYYKVATKKAVLTR